MSPNVNEFWQLFGRCNCGAGRWPTHMLGAGAGTWTRWAGGGGGGLWFYCSEGARGGQTAASTCRGEVKQLQGFGGCGLHPTCQPRASAPVARLPCPRSPGPRGLGAGAPLQTPARSLDPLEAPLAPLEAPCACASLCSSTRTLQGAGPGRAPPGALCPRRPHPEAAVWGQRQMNVVPRGSKMRTCPAPSSPALRFEEPQTDAAR